MCTCESAGRIVAKMAKLSNIEDGNMRECGVLRSEPAPFMVFILDGNSEIQSARKESSRLSDLFKEFV